MIVYFFALIGLITVTFGLYIAVLFHGFFTEEPFGGTNEPTVQNEIITPDHKFRALHILSSGGGAAGWCREFVIIRPATIRSTIPTYANAKNEIVFSTRCSTDPFTMHWTASNQLLIRYKLNLQKTSDFELRATDKTGSILIKFEPTT